MVYILSTLRKHFFRPFRSATFLWAISDEERLGVEARREILEPDNEVFLSAASGWEISIKFGLGKLPLPEDPARYVPRQREAAGFVALPIDEDSALQMHRLPPHHRDPFDRILVSQALTGGLVLATNDPFVQAYPVRTVW